MVTSVFNNTQLFGKETSPHKVDCLVTGVTGLVGNNVARLLLNRGLSVRGLAADFVQQWAANHAGFPRGVDVFLAAQSQLVGLPRTTAIHLLEGH